MILKYLWIIEVIIFAIVPITIFLLWKKDRY